MSDLIIKEVNFNGTMLMAVQAQDRNIYVGVKWICQGLGFDKSKSDNQVQKIQEDKVLSKGACKINLPTKGGNQEILCLELRFLPLWLAKVNVNIVDDPTIQNKLVDYQLHAADVLAQAFLQEEKWENPKLKYKQIGTELRRREANIREANMYYKLADKFPYNSRHRQTLYSKAVEVLAGEKLTPETGLSLFDDSLN